MSEVVKRALEPSATAIVLVRSHPSGDPTPSRADIEMTKQIRVGLEDSRHRGARPHHRRSRELQRPGADLVLSLGLWLVLLLFLVLALVGRLVLALVGRLVLVRLVGNWALGDRAFPR